MLTGACQCGRIQYEIDGEPRFMYQCFCGKCRAASGASFVTNIIVDTDRFRITAGKESLKAFESSPKKFRHFCSACGSPIYNQPASKPDLLGVYVGTLDDPSTFKPQVVMFTSRGHIWDHLDSALPKLPYMRPSS